MCYCTEDKNGQAAGIKEQNGTTALTNGSRQSKAAYFDVSGVVKTSACINTCKMLLYGRQAWRLGNTRMATLKKDKKGM